MDMMTAGEKLYVERQTFYNVYRIVGKEIFKDVGAKEILHLVWSYKANGRKCRNDYGIRI